MPTPLNTFNYLRNVDYVYMRKSCSKIWGMINQPAFLSLPVFSRQLRRCCWLSLRSSSAGMPHHIIAMWVEFGRFPLTDATFVFRIISHCLAYGNSCINPILYAFLSENFRKACKQVFTCRFFYSPPPVEKVVRIRMDNFSMTHSTTNIWLNMF